MIISICHLFPKFRWQGTSTSQSSLSHRGNELHMAVAEGDREKVLQILRSSPNPQDPAEAA